MTDSVRHVRVWDLPTRVFHWALAGAITAEMFTAGLIDIRGKFNRKVATDRWVDVDGQPAYLLAPGSL